MTTVLALLLLLPAQDGPAPQPADPIEAVRAATVLIETLGPMGRATGSGFVVDDDGTIATAAHVIHRAWQVRIRLATGQVLPVLGVRAVDPRLDLALLAVPQVGIAPVRMGDADSLRPGQRLLALGSPMGLATTVADGLLGSFHAQGGHRMLQISIPVSPGSSGGPVITEAGVVVGLVVSGFRGNGAENLNFALPAGYVRAYLAGSTLAAAVPLTRANRDEITLFDPVRASREDEMPLPPVNTALITDYAALEGVEMLARWKRADGVEFTSLVRFGLALDPSGLPLVEQLRETVIWQAGEVGRETHRTVYRAGGSNDFRSAVSFRSDEQRAPEYDGLLEAHGDRYVVSDGTGGSRVGRAPRGVIPPSLANVVLAAQPGALPEVVEFLVLDPQRERLVRARFEFTGRSTRKLPVAREGTGCNGTVTVDQVRVEVLEGVREIGLERKPVVVLAAAPHLVLEDHLKCLRLPRTVRGLVIAGAGR